MFTAALSQMTVEHFTWSGIFQCSVTMTKQHVQGKEKNKDYFTGTWLYIKYKVMHIKAWSLVG